MSVGKTIKQLRERNGWTQAELAEQVGISQSRVSQLELDEDQSIRLDTVIRLMSVFDVPFEAFSSNSSIAENGHGVNP